MRVSNVVGSPGEARWYNRGGEDEHSEERLVLAARDHGYLEL